jgi:hypothetical protein
LRFANVQNENPAKMKSTNIGDVPVSTGTIASLISPSHRVASSNQVGVSKQCRPKESVVETIHVDHSRGGVAQSAASHEFKVPSSIYSSRGASDSLLAHQSLLGSTSIEPSGQRGMHDTYSQPAAIQNLENSLDPNWRGQIHHLYPEEKVVAVEYITKSMLKHAKTAPSRQFEVGMVVDFVLAEPTTNRHLNYKENDQLLRTTYGPFLAKHRPGIITTMWDNHCAIVPITTREGKVLEGMSIRKTFECVAILNPRDNFTKSNAGEDSWIHDLEHEPLRIFYLMTGKIPL